MNRKCVGPRILSSFLFVAINERANETKLGRFTNFASFDLDKLELEVVCLCERAGSKVR